jgi:lipopolysaccharide export LptBFGC system permease protein LptF
MPVSLNPLQSGAVGSTSYSSTGVVSSSPASTNFSSLMSGSGVSQYNTDIAEMTAQNQRMLAQARAMQGQGGSSSGGYSFTAGMGTSPGNDSMDIAEMSRQQAQMLGVQIAMQRENTMFSSISNVLKTKHDTAKNSISNIR